MATSWHGIIVVGEVGTAPRGRPFPGMENGLAQGPVPTGCLSRSDVIRQFKILTTRRYIEGVRNEQCQSGAIQAINLR